ncbi:MAG: 16S rRNA (uracil(1498)-N(3))-methyltransferase [Clostridia bacterium]|nr:16S rRNA (uracil(1498)-N(3))-methyltransferase [Clostridia bacterium]
MPKFFVKNNQIKEDRIIIVGEDVNHIKNVLRLKVDDNIQICNSDTAQNYTCGISKLNDNSIECIIFNEIESNSESDIDITIFQGIPKADKMELIIQKCVELGVNQITPVEMKRCIAKIEDKAKNKKIERWQKISEVAAKQCGRDKLPKINNVINVKNICNIICEYDIVLLAYENEEINTLKNEIQKLKNIKNKEIKIGIIIGPEGGIEKEEVDLLKESGAKVITLGKRILRTETVAFVLASIIMYELGDLGGKL